MQASEPDFRPALVLRALHGHGIAARLGRVESLDLAPVEFPILWQTPGDALVLSESQADWDASLRAGPAKVASNERCIVEPLPPATHDVLSAAGLMELGRPLLPRALRVGLLTSLLLAIGLLSPALTALVVDRALPQGSVNVLVVAGAGLLLASAASAWLGALHVFSTNAAYVLIESRMLGSLLQRLIGAPLGEVTRCNTGELLQGFELCARLVKVAFENGVASLLRLLLALLYVALVSWLEPALGVVCVATFAALFTGLLVLALRRDRLYSAELLGDANRDAALHGLLAGAAAIRALGVANEAVARWAQQLLSTTGIEVRRRSLEEWITGVAELGRQALLAIAVVFGAWLCLRGTLSLGTYMVLIVLVGTLGRGLQDAVGFMLAMLDGVREFKRARRLTSWTSSSERRFKPGRTACEYAIQMENVWFRYAPSEPWILQDYSLCLRRAEDFLLSGPSGSGKSTVLRLIAGLLVPERGSVLVMGGVPGGTGTPVKYLPQMPYLPAGSIRDALELLSGSTRERILKAAELTGLAAWVSKLPMGLDTALLPGGGNVSGGQRQLILFTAAVASESPVLLLDEHASHLDAVHRRILNDGSLLKGRTVVRVDHRE
jgi:ABC-type bacteriocin/lantibiotic exporter with double-glycine peptidase domain